MKKVLKNVVIIILMTIFIVSNVSLTISQAKQLDRTDIENSYDYTNSIYDNGFEDTYLFDTTDSIITTKTGLDRNIPETFGKYAREEYPIPNVSRVKSAEMFEEIKAENLEIMNNVETDIANGTLKKHVAADGQYYGTVSDDVKAVEKLAYINTYLYGQHSLAVFIPAGEVATVTIPEEFRYLIEQGKITLSIGIKSADATNYSRNNGTENRMPYLTKTFKVTDTTTKIGTPFGGMAYIEFPSSIPSNLVIPVTISGGIDTPYYDLGRTTLEEWQEAKNAPGLYAEFRTPLVRFIMPSSTIRDIEDPYDVLSFWMNAATLSTYPYNNQTRRYPITMIFDSYVFVGSAVATVGAWICNMPTSWTSGSLNYDTLMTYGGWGTMHEFNHHWQGTYMNGGKWGVGSVGEVTNNVMNSATYILYTDIDSYRTETTVSSGWNGVANPYFNLNAVMNTSKSSTSPVTSVYMYNSFMHEFGVQNYMEVIRSNYYGGTYNGVQLSAYNSEDTRYDDWAYRTCVIEGKDLTYYFKDVLHFELTDETIEKIKALGFEEYIPVENVYSVGPANTGKPYYISGDTYNFNFEKYTVSAGNIEKIEVGTPKYGTLKKNDDGTYTYTKSENMPEGEIDEFELKVTVSANDITQTRTLPCKLQFEHTKFEQPTPYYTRPLTQVSNKNTVDLSKATVLSTPEGQEGDGGGPTAIIDGDTSTYFHSRYSGGTITAFPHEYVIDLGKESTFEQIDIGTRTNNANGPIGDYEIYISEDNENWTKIAEDKNRYGNSSSPVNITVKLENSVTARYFKVIALNNRNGNKFTVVSEISLSTGMDNKEIIAQNNSLLQYEGDWTRDVEGCFINGATYNSTNGTLKFAIMGSQIGIGSAKDATVQIKIDKEEWKTYELTGKKKALSLVLKGLEDGHHNIQVKVVSGELAIDMLSTDGKFVEYSPNILKGDVNLDEKITPTDLLLLKRHIVAGEDNKDWILTGDNFKAGDINDDNEITPTDLLLLKRLVLESTD